MDPSPPGLAGGADPLTRRLTVLIGVLAVVAELVAAWFGAKVEWWLFLPEAMVIWLGVVAALVWMLVTRRQDRQLWPVAAMVAVTALIVLGTYSFALPLKMRIISASATADARRLGLHTCTTAPAALDPVSLVIEATRACATIAHVVVFDGPSGSRLIFSPAGPGDGQLVLFPESCLRHLYGWWWASRADNPDLVDSPCPSGFRFTGSP